jgi:hypothetical protein
MRRTNIGAVILTGNYPSAWATDELMNALGGKFVALIDTLIPVAEMAKSEGQIALDLAAHRAGNGAPGRATARASAGPFNAAETRRAMAAAHATLSAFLTDVAMPATGSLAEADMQVVEL